MNNIDYTHDDLRNEAITAIMDLTEDECTQLLEMLKVKGLIKEEAE